MKTKKPSNKTLEKIWLQVPVDYYQKETNKNFLKRFWHDQKFKTFQDIVGSQNPKKILDAGCASGYMANRISKVFPYAKVIAVDVYKKAVLFGRKKYPHIKFQVADVHNLPFKKNSFDLIVCYEVIEHLVDPLKALMEIKRVLKKEGYAIVAMDSGNILFRMVWLICENTISSVWHGAHLHPYKHKELEKVIKKAGFKIVRKKFSHFSMEVSFLLSLSKNSRGLRHQFRFS